MNSKLMSLNYRLALGMLGFSAMVINGLILLNLPVGMPTGEIFVGVVALSSGVALLLLEAYLIFTGDYLGGSKDKLIGEEHEQ